MQIFSNWTYKVQDIEILKNIFCVVPEKNRNEASYDFFYASGDFSYLENCVLKVSKNYKEGEAIISRYPSKNGGYLVVNPVLKEGKAPLRKLVLNGNELRAELVKENPSEIKSTLVLEIAEEVRWVGCHCGYSCPQGAWSSCPYCSSELQ